MNTIRRKARVRRAVRRYASGTARPAPPRAPARTRPAARSAAAPISPVLERALVRVVICGVIFVSLVTLKLVLPGNLETMRGTMRTWLVRDADFAEAFSAVGHAVSGTGGVLDSLEDAYVAVFGKRDESATEVSGAAEDVAAADVAAAETEDASDASAAQEQAASASALDTRELPALAVAEQRILGFDYAAPLDGELTSGFGWREHPSSGREAFHYGVDLSADEGAAIACFADGTVGAVGESTELGKYLTVQHANGFSTLYAHCSRIVVSPGDSVARGGKLAEVGSTGNATGAHLHFEVHDGEEYLDPVYYLS